MTHDGLGLLLLTEGAEGAGIDGRHRADPARDQDRRRGQLPASRQRDGDQVVRRADPRRRLRASSTASRSSSGASSTGRTASRTTTCRSSATTSRARSARRSCTACWPACSRIAASSWSAPSQLNVGGNMDFYNMLERHPAGVQEDLQDERRHLAARLRPRAGERPHRPERLRAVADRSQVGATSGWRDARSATCRSTSS